MHSDKCQTYVLGDYQCPDWYRDGCMSGAIKNDPRYDGCFILPDGRVVEWGDEITEEDLMKS